VSFLKAIFNFAEGREKELQAKEASVHETFLAESERIQGKRDQNQLTEELFTTLAGQKLTIAANGVDLSSPGAQKITAQTIKRGEKEISKIKTDTVLRRQARRQRARSLLRKAQFEKFAGFIKGSVEVEKGIQKIFARGAGG